MKQLLALTKLLDYHIIKMIICKPRWLLLSRAVLCHEARNNILIQQLEGPLVEMIFISGTCYTSLKADSLVSWCLSLIEPQYLDHV